MSEVLWYLYLTPKDDHLDGRCESCGEPIGFSGSHSDEDCARSLLREGHWSWPPSMMLELQARLHAGK